ncbi:hypothetical protein C8F01DRAFT_988577, partial [Mycena amicta]
QFDKLIVGPCGSLPGPRQGFVIVIDGLDECGTPAVQKEIFRLLSDTVRQYPSTFRILIASRPEAYILDYLQGDMLAVVLQSTDIEKSFSDVEMFLVAEFDCIHCTHWATKNVPRPWPLASIGKRLIENSSGYFVYAATVIRFLDDDNSHQDDQLELVIRPFSLIDIASADTAGINCDTGPMILLPTVHVASTMTKTAFFVPP